MVNLTAVYGTLQGELGRFEKAFETVLKSQDGVSRRLYEKQAKLKGKRLRPILLFLSARATGQIKPIHYNLATIIELIHNATLVHDDVLDDAVLRRHLPTFNQRWGNETAILFGDLLFSNAFRTCAEIESGEALKVLSKTAQEMCYGELTHTARKFDLSMKENEYLQIITDKTASLFSAACYLGAFFATPDKKLHLALQGYGRAFGMAYQIRDDYYDLVSNEETEGKTTGLDLTKGKITLPLIMALRRLAKRGQKRLGNLISEGVSLSNPAKAGQLLKLLDSCNALADCRKKICHYISRAKEHLKNIPGSDYQKLLVHTLENIANENNISGKG